MLAFVLAPVVSSAGQDGDPTPSSSERASLSSTTPSAEEEAGTPTPTPVPTPTPAPSAEPTPEVPTTARVARLQVEPRVIGVVTFNQFRKLTQEQLEDDARALAGRDDVDVIGWQESWDSARILHGLKDLGWRTRTFEKGAKELAVSWRADEFVFVEAEQRQVARGIDTGDGNYPFGDRWAIRVTLRDRASGELVSVLNTHLPQAIEDLDNPGTWRLTYNSARARTQLTRLARMWGAAPGRWVVGTGDYNVDAGAEAKVRPEGGLSEVFADRAVSSYAVLGIGDLGDTHPVSGRHIDYVHAGRASLKRGHLAFVGQRTVPGLDSDHRPLVVRLRLS